MSVAHGGDEKRREGPPDSKLCPLLPEAEGTYQDVLLLCMMTSFICAIHCTAVLLTLHCTSAEYTLGVEMDGVTRTLGSS